MFGLIRVVESWSDMKVTKYRKKAVDSINDTAAVATGKDAYYKDIIKEWS
jgi:hypothetical protein